MLSLVPHSVRMRKAGLVRDPSVREMSMEPKWVLPSETLAAKQGRYMAKVDRVISVLTRFVSKCIRAMRYRKAYMVFFPALRACEDWTRNAMLPNWGNMMYEEDRRVRAYFLAMSEDEWRAYCRAQIATTRDLSQLVAAWKPINAARDANLAKIREQERVWQEVSRAQLHNRQRAAPVRVARVVASGRYAALDGSDSE